jgi:hypothetical protein
MCAVTNSRPQPGQRHNAAPCRACTDRAMPWSRAARTFAGVAPAGLAVDTHANIVIGPPRSPGRPARPTPVTVGLPAACTRSARRPRGRPGAAGQPPARPGSWPDPGARRAVAAPARPRHTRSLLCTASGPPGHGAEPGSGTNGNGARSLARPGGAGESWGGTSCRAARHSSLEDEPDVEPTALTGVIRGWKLGHWPRRGGA